GGPGAARRRPHLLGLVEFPAERPVDLPRPFDGFHQLGARAAHHQADGIPAIAAGMSAELAEHAVSLAAAASAAEEDFEHLALQQPNLGGVATRRPSNPNLGLGDHGAIFSSAPSLRPDVPRTPGRRQMASQPAVSTGHPAAETPGFVPWTSVPWTYSHSVKTSGSRVLR